MAEEDVVVRSYVQNILYPGLGLFVAYFIFKRQIRHWRLRLAAWIMTRVGCKSNKIFGEHKKDLFHSMKKLKATVGTLKVLEIGAGGGVNFKFYPAGTKVTCLDPNPCFEPYVENNAVVSGLVDMTGFIKAFGENMSDVADCSYDVVVSTLVLCTVRDPDRVLKEVKRVLKHNGKYYFMDHVCAEKRSIIYFFQRLINPAWRVFADGCEVTRDTGGTIKAAGFKTLDMRYFTAPTKLFLIRPCCMGIATKE
ncbi:methyltransferase-like protein 7A [Mizuhopecten yessoensis]|uniref:Methyltransferase-like protein 7A n=1 Tax=Mizuhopecten yessoensis TaxID=6573 RepID=A0A210PVZ6_MIZYE|nr:methyltransferase-like protein 7A [Mizuhopecten yessoensis]OWF40632.1 Methyltransferase-like protein 7A [Mizuhopecten yessoensis]